MNCPFDGQDCRREERGAATKAITDDAIAAGLEAWDRAMVASVGRGPIELERKKWMRAAVEAAIGVGDAE